MYGELRSTTRQILTTLAIVVLYGHNALPEQGFRVKVEVVSDHAGSEQPHDVFIVAEPLVIYGPQQAVEGRVVARTSIGTTAELDLRIGAYVVAVYADGYWGTSTEIVLPGVQDVKLKLWRAEMALGTALSRNEQLPELRVKFTPTHEDQKEPYGELRCSLNEGRFACPLPLGKFDLRFRAPGFMGIYFWEINVGPDAPVTFGELLFETGSSLVGFVRSETGIPEEAKGATVQLQTTDGTPVTTRVNGKKLAVIESTNSRGFWQMKSVPPGEYQVVATAPGFDETSAVVHVFPEKETTYGAPLVLSRPRHWEIYVDPPTDPNGEQWSLRLFRRTQGQEIAPLNASTTGDGLFTMSPRQGHYRLILASPTMGNVYTDEFDFGPDSDPFHISLDFTRVVGQLRLGRKPLAGTLSFGGTSGAVSVHMNADRTGRFEGLLPEEGAWSVAVNTSQPRLTRFLSNVQVAKNSSGYAFVDINLPNTKLVGVAVDERGQPVVNATATVFRRGIGERPQHLLTNKEGEFEFRALAEDTYTISATAVHPVHGTLESDPMTVEISEALVSPGKLTLHLRSSTKVQGRVLSTVGPLVNASIFAIPEDGVGAAAQADTDVNGQFELEVRRNTQQLNLIASAPGFSLRILTVRLGGRSSPLEIPLVKSGGTLIVDIVERTPSSPGSSFGRLLLLRENSWTPLTALHEWATVNGGGHDGTRMVIPQMEPGSYRLCPVDPGDRGIRPADNCEAGVLFPDEDLVLKVKFPG